MHISHGWNLIMWCRIRDEGLDNVVYEQILCQKTFGQALNIMQNPHVGMILIIPGEEWTMRINGQARVVDDPPLLERLSARGRPAQLAIEIKVEECFFHCPRSFKRAQLWNSERFQKYEGHSWGKILAQRT